MKRKPESGFVPFLVLGAVFMAGALIILVVSSVKVSFPQISIPILPPKISQQTTLNLPQNPPASQSSQLEGPVSLDTPSFELPQNPNQRLVLPTPTSVPTPPPTTNSTPVNQTQSLSNINLNYLAAGAINIEYNPTFNIEVKVYPLDNSSPSLDRVGNVSFVTILSGKYLLHFSNPDSLGVRLPNDTAIEIQPNQTTLINVNLIDGTLSTTFGWAP